MTTGEESIREQLLRLLGRGQSPRAQALVQSADSASKPSLASSKPAAPVGVKPEDAWKIGVKPIKFASRMIAYVRPRSYMDRPSGATRPANKRPQAPTVAPRSAGAMPPQARIVRPPIQVPTTPPAPILTRTGCFRFPERWVEKGSLLQPGSTANGAPLTIRIGIDFGTAYTKLAVGVAGNVFFLDWDGIHKGDCHQAGDSRARHVRRRPHLGARLGRGHSAGPELVPG